MTLTLLALGRAAAVAVVRAGVVGVPPGDAAAGVLPVRKPELVAGPAAIVLCLRAPALQSRITRLVVEGAAPASLWRCWHRRGCRGGSWRRRGLLDAPHVA